MLAGIGSARDRDRDRTDILELKGYKEYMRYSEQAIRTNIILETISLTSNNWLGIREERIIYATTNKSTSSVRRHRFA